jgi:hypothetical protein
MDVSPPFLPTTDGDGGSSGSSADSTTLVASSTLATLGKVEKEIENEAEKEDEEEEDDAPADLFHILEKVRCRTLWPCFAFYLIVPALHDVCLVIPFSGSMMYAEQRRCCALLLLPLHSPSSSPFLPLYSPSSLRLIFSITTLSLCLIPIARSEISGTLLSTPSSATSPP